MSGDAPSPTSTETPLPCPFCGGLDVAVTDATRVLGVWVLIHRCRVAGGLYIPHATECGAVSIWNTRAPQANPGTAREPK